MLQKISYVATILLWALSVFLFVSGKTIFLFFGLLFLHLFELLFVGYKIGRKAGISNVRIIISCMLFGFLWWLPLKKSLQK